MPDLLLWAAENWGLLAAAALLLAAVARVGAVVWPIARRIIDLVDDLTGEPGRPGVAARPGVMERLQQLDATTTNHGRALAELRPNGGSSIKDVVTRIDARTEHLAQRIEAVERVVVPDRPRGTRRPWGRPEA